MRLAELLAICRREMAGVRDPAPGEAEILVSAVTGIPRSRLFLSMGDDVRDAMGRLLPLIARRVAGEPLQYVLGAWEFFGREFLLSPDTLIPRPETEGLAERAVAALRRSPMARPLALEVGTGSGAIAVTLAAEVPAACVVATDLSPAALRKARENAARHGVSARVLPICCDLLSALKCGVRFAVVVSNPPYVTEGEWPLLPPEVRDHEPPVALLAGRDGLSVLRPLVAGAARHLSPGGELWCEIGASQGEAASSLPCGSLRPLGVFRDLAGRDRYVGWKNPEQEC
ncbi:peptide chain release factor N(5)-glutamine methyltransferase [Candidatus Deferrimicrobium sp.]|uniref:peptide chain release factor N(5)-glutamine methyltransferase n=1 Tax=Candidatus Deferrimicrobium sp. TaxID=3060586 RepID=UPI002ED2F743